MNENVVHYVTSKYLPDKDLDGEEIQAVCLPKERLGFSYNLYVIREDLEEEFLEMAKRRKKEVLKLEDSSFLFDRILGVALPYAL